MEQQQAFTEFMNSHTTKKTGLPFTHTKIGDKALNIFPASYHIAEDELSEFYRLYKSFIKSGNKEYLTTDEIENLIQILNE